MTNKFSVKNNFRLKFWLKRILVKKILANKIFCEKDFSIKIIFGEEKFLVQKYFRFEKFLVNKNWVLLTLLLLLLKWPPCSNSQISNINYSWSICRRGCRRVYRQVSLKTVFFTLFFLFFWTPLLLCLVGSGNLPLPTFM